MPVLVDVNEPSQLPPQPHPQQEHEQQQQQQQRVHCSSTTRRQPLVGIENTEAFTAKEKEESLSSPSSVRTHDHPDSKENCPPPKATRKRSRSTIVVTKGIESMPAQTFSIVLPLQRGDTSSKCGAASSAEVDVGVEGKSKASRSRANKGRDISKVANRIDVDSTRNGVDIGVINGASPDGLSQSEPVATTATTTTTSADMYRKPDISYSHLILHAISQSPNERLTLREIYAWIETRHPFYRDTPTGWQVTSAMKRKGQQAILLCALVFFVVVCVFGLLHLRRFTVLTTSVVYFFIHTFDTLYRTRLDIICRRARPSSNWRGSRTTLARVASGHCTKTPMRSSLPRATKRGERVSQTMTIASLLFPPQLLPLLPLLPHPQPHLQPRWSGPEVPLRFPRSIVSKMSLPEATSPHPRPLSPMTISRVRELSGPRPKRSMRPRPHLHRRIMRRTWRIRE